MHHAAPARLDYAVSHYLWPASGSVTAFLDEIERLGFSAVGLTERALAELPLPELRQALAARGLGVSSINSAGYFLFEGDAWREQEARNAVLLQQSAELGSAVLNVIVGGSTQQPLSGVRERAVEALAHFAGQASRSGVRLAIEPYFPGRAGRNCFNSIAQLRTIFGLIPGLSATADLFHSWWDPDLDELLSGGGISLGLLQICDVALAPAGDGPRRVPLGEGFLDWRSAVRSTRLAFPQAPVEIELFAHDLPGRSCHDVLVEAARRLAPS